MKAINAIEVPVANRYDLERRFFASHFDRASAKRIDRRRQRHALRGELPKLVESYLAADEAVARELLVALQSERAYSAKRGVSHLVAVPSAKRDTPTGLLYLPDAPRQTRTVTVIRKQANRRRVVESMQVFSYPLAA